MKPQIPRIISWLVVCLLTIGFVLPEAVANKNRYKPPQAPATTASRPVFTIPVVKQPNGLSASSGRRSGTGLSTTALGAGRSSWNSGKIPPPGPKVKTSSSLATGTPSRTIKGFQISANQKIKGFQEHHIIPKGSKLTKNHPLLKLAGFNLESRANKIFLPTTLGGYKQRSPHSGGHYPQVSKNVARQMNTVLREGQKRGWSQQQYNQELRKIISDERQLLRSGHRAINKNKREWAE